MGVPSCAKLQRQRFAIDGDLRLASRRDLVSPRVLGKDLGSEPERTGAYQVHSRPLILADRLQKFGVRHQRLVRLKRNRPSERLRIFEGHFEVHVSEVAAVETFNNAEGFRVRVPGKIQPGSVVETVAD